MKNTKESLKPKVGKLASDKSFEIDDNQKKTFTNFFGTKVEVNVASNGKGKITIPFHSEEDFNRIMKLINN